MVELTCLSIFMEVKTIIVTSYNISINKQQAVSSTDIQISYGHSGFIKRENNSLQKGEINAKGTHTFNNNNLPSANNNKHRSSLVITIHLTIHLQQQQLGTTSALVVQIWCSQKH